MNDVLPSEVLFGFAAWLTGRDERICFSARDNAAPAAEVVAEFIKANGWDSPRDNFPERLVYPPSAAELHVHPTTKQGAYWTCKECRALNVLDLEKCDCGEPRPTRSGGG